VWGRERTLNQFEFIGGVHWRNSSALRIAKTPSLHHERAMDRPALRNSLLVATVASIALFTNLGVPRLWDRDEPRNAQCAVEMRARGDWIVPTFNDELRAHKPVLLYWLMLASYSVFGETEFAARLPSALLGVATALIVMAMGTRLFSSRAGLWAGIILATSLSFDIAARAATPDAALLFTATASIALFARAAVTADKSFTPPSLLAWIGIYSMLGLAALAKGPVGVVLVVAILGLFHLVVHPEPRFLAKFPVRRFVASAWQMRPVTLVLAVLAVAAPWYIAVHLATDGAFTDEFFFRHNIERATSAMEGHRGPIVYYLGAALVGFFPWSILAVPLLLETRHALREHGPDDLGVKLMLCWIVVWIGAFSVVSTKLPSYIMPAYPAIALLAGLYVDRWLAARASTAERWMPWALAALAVVGVALCICMPLVAQTFLPGDEILGTVGAIPIVTAAAAWLAARRGRAPIAATSLAIGATVFVVAMFGFGQVRVDRRQVSESLATFVRANGGDDANLVAFRDLEPSMVFYARKAIPTLREFEEATTLFARNESAYLLASSDAVDELRRHLPEDVEIVAREAKFLESGETVIFARTPQTIAARRAAATRTAETPTNRPH
jgi:4-amino-4-deoxy-L-arabinose transferase-like glycosyltransferase